jgi:hypothetical protein
MPRKRHRTREEGRRIKGDSGIVLVAWLFCCSGRLRIITQNFVMSSYLTYNEADIHCNCLVRVVVASKKSVHMNVNEGHRQ